MRIANGPIPLPNGSNRRSQEHWRWERFVAFRAGYYPRRMIALLQRRNVGILKTLGGLILTVGFVLQLDAQEPRAVLDQYCVSCHNDRFKSGKVSLTPASAKTPLQNPELWEKVVTKLRHRHMPPLGMRRPDERTYEAVVSALVKSLDQNAAESSESR